jgi:hypothetical protein
VKINKFKLLEIDEFGNVFVECPVCVWEFKLEGIRQHILRKVVSGDKEHKQWFAKHKWVKGTRISATTIEGKKTQSYNHPLISELEILKIIN